MADADTFVRTTLRYPDFCSGWNQLVQWQLTDETIRYQTDGLTGESFLKKHLAHHQIPFPAINELLQKQLLSLGLLGDCPLPDGEHSAADILQYLLETRLPLQATDQDMVVMLHEIDYTLEDQQHSINSSLVVKGRDALHTAMAQTVGLPLGIAAVLLLRNQLPVRGLHIPILPEIYEPVLQWLEDVGIRFEEYGDL
jgi:saccharopine dehydrogenase (NADP+, L-glutamate forming)